MVHVPPETWPIVAIASPIVLFLWPWDNPPLFFWRIPGSAAARLGLWRELLGVLFSGLASTPTLLQTFIADIFCSMPKIFSDLLYSACIYLPPVGDTSTCTPAASPAFAVASSVCLVIPFYFRLMQSLRCAYDAWTQNRSSLRRHLLNACKYTASITLVVISILKPGYERGTTARQRLETAWLCLSVLCTAANYAWDVVMDWGLLQGIRDEAEADTGLSSCLLRPHRLYPDWFYYSAICSNAVMRFGWAVYVSPEQEVVSQHAILLLACVELVRRFVWALLRLEWQHVKTACFEPEETELTGTSAHPPL
mmetsp:Transcript_40964/g.55817  ORF Transcript_40964/g.55817 Transcript_40964/m.55817 type:complete len:309 (-) Transcript_40964:783-1709(-)